MNRSNLRRGRNLLGRGRNQLVSVILGIIAAIVIAVPFFYLGGGSLLRTYGSLVWGYIYWLLAFALGASVGIGELLDRYRDSARRVLLPPPAVTYIAINGFASCIALGLMIALDITVGEKNTVSFTDVLIAGLGAMALFRSSFFTTTVGDQQIGIGPSAVLQVLLQSTDRQVDRHRANERFQRISQIMYAVSYDEIQRNLPAFAFAAMEHLDLSVEEREKVQKEIASIAGEPGLNEYAKKIMIGLTVQRLVGMEVLDTMVRSIHTTSQQVVGLQASLADQLQRLQHLLVEEKEEAIAETSEAALPPLDPKKAQEQGASSPP